jgi:hypothetical protein
MTSLEKNLVKEFNVNDITALSGGSQPQPQLQIPGSLLTALDTFMVGATYKRSKDADQNCAFLCHVSTRKSDHNYIVSLLRKYKADLSSELKKKSPSTLARLKKAYLDLSDTHDGIKATSFNDLIANIEFFSPGITVKLVNGDTDEDVAVRSPYNLFVGGNKLGRGVTIKNLLVSYYGRNPKSPQADTVLQHARMYGYRRKDIGLLRLFLPPQLHSVFKAINKMERGLRQLIGERPGEEFRGVYVESGLSPTRKNILAPGSVGVYAGGSNYNPSQMLRNASAKVASDKISERLTKVQNKTAIEFPIGDIVELIGLTKPDDQNSEHIWNSVAVAESVAQFAKLHEHKSGYVYVDRERGLEQSRRETQGIIEGGEYQAVPANSIALFMLRTKASAGKEAVWWPQIRFPDGNYAFAFAI